MKRISNKHFKEDESMSMNVSNNMGVNNATVYGSKETETEQVQEKVSASADEPKKSLGVLVEISPEGEQAAKMSETMKDIRKNGYDIGERNVIFYGASVTREQGEQLKSIIQDLEKQGYVTATPDENGNYEKGDEALGYSWEPGTYAQMGLKVSQLSYACKNMGLSDDVTEQITSVYGKQQESKTTKTNNLIDIAKKTLDEIRPEYQKMMQAYGNTTAKKNSAVSNLAGEDSVELNKKTNSEIYDIFATLDTSSKDTFKASFEKALDKLKNYFNDDPIELYTGTDREKRQLDELVKRFNSFFERA